MTARFSPETAEKIVEARERPCEFYSGLTYQKCRFCGAGWPQEKSLWKYSVRHYVCSACRALAVEQHQASLRELQRLLDVRFAQGR